MMRLFCASLIEFDLPDHRSHRLKNNYTKAKVGLFMYYYDTVSKTLAQLKFCHQRDTTASQTLYCNEPTCTHSAPSNTCEYKREGSLKRPHPSFFRCWLGGKCIRVLLIRSL